MQGFDRLRNPEYTGENRCWKCTVLNTLLALGVVAIVAGIDRLAAGVLLVATFAAIYFWGFLIPGTPRLTKRYFPHDVLAWFGTHETDEAVHETDEAEVPGGRTIESVLFEAEVVRPVDDDLELDPEFRRRWRDRIQSYRGEEDFVEMLRTIGGLDGLRREDATVAAVGGAFVAETDGVRIGQWESRGAFLADVAAARELERRYDDWDFLSFDERTAVLGGLRLWMDWCPLCDGRVTLDTETVESCCRIVEVVAGTCEDCGRRIFEVNAPEDAVTAP